MLYEKVRELCNLRHTTISELEKQLGLSKGAIYKWKKSSPSSDTLLKMSQLLGVPNTYWSGEELTEEYYLDPEAKQLAQEIFERPELRVLFDATRNVSKEDIQFVIDMIDRMKK